MDLALRTRCLSFGMFGIMDVFGEFHYEGCGLLDVVSIYLV